MGRSHMKLPPVRRSSNGEILIFEIAEKLRQYQICNDIDRFKNERQAFFKTQSKPVVDTIASFPDPRSECRFQKKKFSSGDSAVGKRKIFRVCTETGKNKRKIHLIPLPKKRRVRRFFAPPSFSSSET